MPTTPRGFPYPESTDPVAQGADAIKALAEAINTRVGAIAAGSTTITVTNAATGSKVVTLPAGRFTAAPILAVSSGNSSWLVSPSAKTATGFTLYARHYQGNTSNGNVPGDWIAIQV